MKKTTIEKDYEKVVRIKHESLYKGPEQQGLSIKKCTVLKNVEISYGDLAQAKTIGFNCC